MAIAEMPRLAACIAAAGLLLPAASAAAEFYGSAAILSDYRYRGASLSHGRAVPQLHLGADAQDGWYLGGFASGVKLGDERNPRMQLLLYAGRAARRPSGSAWEAGAIGAVFPDAGSYNYLEAYAGFVGADASGRVYVSPAYFGGHAATLYLELNASRALWQTLRLDAHIGYLHALRHPGDEAPYSADRPDISIGLSAELAPATLAATWVAARQENAANARAGRAAAQAWVLQLALPF
jgi:uncharacterized protein (TIGR02001 family)